MPSSQVQTFFTLHYLPGIDRRRCRLHGRAWTCGRVYTNRTVDAVMGTPLWWPPFVGYPRESLHGL